jgi:hypothetical protein
LLENDDHIERRLLWLGNDEPGETPLPDNLFGDPQGVRIPIFTDSHGDSWGVTLYNAATDTQMPIIQPLPFEPYHVEINWRGEDLLWVQIADANRAVWAPRLDPFVIGEWLVRVP